MNTLFRIIAVGVLLTATTMAQRGFGPRASGGSPPDPATIVQNQVARLTTLLSLTPAQASQATTIFTNAATAISTLQTTLSTDRDSLQTAIKGNATANIDQLSATIGTLTGQITSVQSKADAAFYAILTTDQQAKLDQLGGFGFGPGRGGPPPGRP
jgi:Spy/CpxP family protein refolding chaperone